MAKFLHIGFSAKVPPKFEDLKAVYDMALDWVVYAPNCCIVFSSSEPDVWYHRLKRVLRDEDVFLIHEIHVIGPQIFTGYLPNFVWAWMQKYTSGPPVPIPPLSHDAGS